MIDCGIHIVVILYLVEQYEIMTNIDNFGGCSENNTIILRYFESWTNYGFTSYFKIVRYVYVTFRGEIGLIHTF